MKMLEMSLKFHWSLFLRIQLTIFQHLFRKWLGADQVTSHYLNQCISEPTHICITRPHWVKYLVVNKSYQFEWWYMIVTNVENFIMFAVFTSNNRRMQHRGHSWQLNICSGVPKWIILRSAKSRWLKVYMEVQISQNHDTKKNEGTAGKQTKAISISLFKPISRGLHVVMKSIHDLKSNQWFIQ